MDRMRLIASLFALTMALVLTACVESDSSDDDSGVINTDPVVEYGGTAVSDTGVSSTMPVLVFGGTDGYGLVWKEAPAVSSGMAPVIAVMPTERIKFARVSSDGDIISGPLAVTDKHFISHLDLAWRGDEFGLIFATDSKDILFQRIGIDGDTLGSVQTVTTSIAQDPAPSIAYNPISSYWASYTIAYGNSIDGNDEIYFARIGPTGTTFDGPRRVSNSAGKSAFPDLVWSGTEFAVTWEDQRHGNTEIYFATADGYAYNIGSEVRISNDTSESVNPALGFDDTAFGIAWSDNGTTDGNLKLTVIEGSTLLFGESTLVSFSGASTRPDMELTGDSGVGVWESEVNGYSQLFLGIFDDLGSQTQQLTSGSADHLNPCLAIDYLNERGGVAYEDYSGTNSVVKVKIVGPQAP